MGLKKTGLAATLAQQDWKLKLMIDEFEKEARVAKRGQTEVPDHLHGVHASCLEDYQHVQQKMEAIALQAVDLLQDCRAAMPRVARR